jgi:hypothetical protein
MCFFTTLHNFVFARLMIFEMGSLQRVQQTAVNASPLCAPAMNYDNPMIRISDIRITCMATPTTNSTCVTQHYTQITTASTAALPTFLVAGSTSARCRALSTDKNAVSKDNCWCVR